MDQSTDGTLLGRLRRGDREALETLVDRHQRALLAHARTLLGHGGPFEDVVQEVFLRLLERPPEIPPEAEGDAERERSAISSWLHKVTRNCAMDTIRAEARRKRREHETASGAAASESRSAGAALVESRDTRAAVERGLALLPAEQREVLVLRLFGDRSYKEIAEITGKKIGTVGWHVSVGLKALSQHLAPWIDDGKSAGAAFARASAASAARTDGGAA
jgi:RNA polymerase sigma-70 factor (ECF subfamily)